jgi:hypothetical protein
LEENRIGKKAVKMFKSYPRTPRNPKDWLVILKGHRKTEHRHIPVNKKQGYSRQHNDIKPTFLPDVNKKRRFTVYFPM